MEDRAQLEWQKTLLYKLGKKVAQDCNPGHQLLPYFAGLEHFLKSEGQFFCGLNYAAPKRGVAGPVRAHSRQVQS